MFKQFCFDLRQVLGQNLSVHQTAELVPLTASVSAGTTASIASAPPALRQRSVLCYMYYVG